jgi:hypothetical protein
MRTQITLELSGQDVTDLICKYIQEMGYEIPSGTIFYHFNTSHGQINLASVTVQVEVKQTEEEPPII